MTWLLVAGECWLGGAMLVWWFRRRPRVAATLSVLATVIGCASLIAAAIEALHGMRGFLAVSWPLPFGALALRLDPLSGVFLVPIAVVGACGAIYAPSYLGLHGGRTPIGTQLAAFMVLLASMALVVVAADMVLFLAAWEIMTVISWYLLAGHHAEQEVRAAGIGYLVAGQVSGAALLLCFVFLAQGGTGWEIPVLPLVASFPPAGLLFALAFIGFGTKAALVPLHVWLPDAHAAAPSHISALMSGVLITLGFYGFMRFLPVLGLSPAISGPVFMGVGALGAAGGILMALSQRDVKRILAYSTIENAGLVALAMGNALLATAAARPAVAALAWTAALLHVWNHAISKSLLFLAGGATAELAGSRDLEHWGGLLRRLPLLGTTLLVGAAAVVGLPGTHGFASEWFLYMGLFEGSQELTGLTRLAMFSGIVILAFTAGTALACFVRLVGIGLLGHPRSLDAANAVPPRGVALAIPVVVLAGLCCVLVLFPAQLLTLLAPAVIDLAPSVQMAPVIELATPLAWLAGALLAGGLLVAAGRVGLRRSRPVRWSVTWDCGYARPEATMQYTATSLAEPITRVVEPVLHTAIDWTPPRSLWPRAMTWVARTPERTLVDLYRPAYLRLVHGLSFLTRFQQGRVMIYLRYVGVALLLLLLWFFLPVGSSR